MNNPNKDIHGKRLVLSSPGERKGEGSIEMLDEQETKQEGVPGGGITQEHEFVLNAKEFFLTLKQSIHLHANSDRYKEIWEFSFYSGFQDNIGNVNIEAVAKNTREIYYLEISNKGFSHKVSFKPTCVVPCFKYMGGSTWLHLTHHQESLLKFTQIRSL